MKDEKLKVALVGCGVISANHLDALVDYNALEVVALCDINAEKAEKCKQNFAPSAQIYTDYYEMLRTEKLDAVHIATPHYLHAEMTLAALRAGVNVFLEKPMCISEEEIESLIEAEKNSTARVCVCYQNRFTEAVKEAKRIADEDGGALGATAALFWKRDEKYYTGSGWRGKKATEGGGAMINQGIHTLDLLTYFLGLPSSLCATVSNHHLKGIIDVEDTAECFIKFRGGAEASYYVTTASPRGDATEISFFTKNHTITVKLPRLFVDGTEVELPEEREAIGKLCYGSGHLTIIQRFYDAILFGTRMPVTLNEAQHSLKILLAAYKSNSEEIII